jgi:predicted amidohydrolase YtcJ
VRLAGKDALFYGVTSFHDAGSSFDRIDFFKKLEAEGNLPIRLYVMVRNESNSDMAEKLSDYRMIADGNDFLTVRSIKRQIDGALGAHGAWLLEPYEDMPTTSGLVLEPVEEIERTAELAVEHGFQVNTHAIGTRANRESLDIYERTWEKMKVSGQELRWRIEHAQHIHPKDVPRFGKLGVIAAMQGIHSTSDGPWIPSKLGEERARTTSYPWRDLINTGAIIGNGTDVPVEPINPIASFYASVTRMTNKGTLFYPEHVMTRMEALKSYTINNAYAAFEEDIKGSLTPGKLADIVILSQDIMTIPEEKIPATSVLYTIVGGKVSFSAQDQ